MRLSSTAYSFSGSHINKFEIHFKQEYGYVYIGEGFTFIIHFL